MNTFWEERFRDEGKIWGVSPSRTAVYAIELFKKTDVRKVLVPGSGYGRNAEAFAGAGFEVTGIEISNTAISIARPGIFERSISPRISAGYALRQFGV